MIITVDGPAASGKTSAAKGIAAALAIPHISSGLLYRAATHVALREELASEDISSLLRLLESHDIQLEPHCDGNLLWLDGENVGAALERDAIDVAVSSIAKHPALRDWVTAQVRTVPAPFVIDGRDMGSVVFPEASYKFYLDASPEIRAQRRVGERNEAYPQVLEALQTRDAQDAKHLAPASDAHYIQTDALSLEQVIAQMLAHMRRKHLLPSIL